MQREQVDEAEKDAMIKAAEDAAWAKREATWRKDRAARARLMEQVAVERRQQLVEKGERRRGFAGFRGLGIPGV
jgi:hypothetical protein